MKFFLLILVSRVSFTVSSDHFTITGWYGDNVTLPCRYDAQAYGSLSFCWGRATVPRSKCSSTILSSVDGAVVFRQSPRYQLLGRVGDGDVSLTILNARWSDGGEYGCRVEIPGWFNDHKVNIQLLIEDVPEPTTEDMIVPTTQDTVKTSTSVQEDDDGAAPADEAPLVAKTQFNSLLLFENFLGVRNLCRLAAVFLCTIVTILVCAHSRGLLQRRTMEHPSTSATENIYDSILEPRPTSSPHFYKT